MANKGTLPPMPPSDEDSIARNHYDGFYKRSARGFWGENEVIRIPVTKDEKCNHEFISKPNGAECQKCHFGLVGKIEVRSGKLFYKGEQIGL